MIIYLLLKRLVYRSLCFILLKFKVSGLEKGRGVLNLYIHDYNEIYLELVYLVTAFVPSDTACLANSPGNKRRTDV